MLLQQILLEPQTAEAAGQALASAHAIPESEDLIERVADILLHLEELGLVRRLGDR